MKVRDDRKVLQRRHESQEVAGNPLNYVAYDNGFSLDDDFNGNNGLPKLSKKLNHF